MPTEKKYHAVALFSGGLDSILATRTIMEQGLSVLCLHFCSPFFGFPEKIAEWKKIYGVEVRAIDINKAYVQMILDGPANGFGRLLNPCIDCKILMLRKAKEIMREVGAEFIISGEVVGQRPMSQRRDALNLIRRDAEVKDCLLRPLSALCMPPSPAEESGLVNRELLHDFSGRGRKQQMALAKRFGITVIPTPAGGCRLTEEENSKRYRMVIDNIANPEPEDFVLADLGRQYWKKTGEQSIASAKENTVPADSVTESITETAFTGTMPETVKSTHWLCVGRNQADNQRLLSVAGTSDFIFKVVGFPGPLGLARAVTPMSESDLSQAAAFMASFSPKALAWSKENPEKSTATNADDGNARQSENVSASSSEEEQDVTTGAKVRVRVLSGPEAQAAILESPYMPGGREFLVIPWRDPSYLAV